MTESWLSDVRDSYDNDAADYADKVRGLLDARPFLRGSLTVFSELARTAGGGPVADIGCGPGYVTRHLNDLGVDAFGIDLSPNMVALARHTYPDLRFEVGTMTDLSLCDGSVTGVLSFWSLIHIPDQSVPAVFAQFRRVMRPGGPLLVGFHVGDPGSHPDECDPEHSGQAKTHYRRPDQIARWLRQGGFSIEAELLMRPDEAVPGAIIIARNHP